LPADSPWEQPYQSGIKVSTDTGVSGE